MQAARPPHVCAATSLWRSGPHPPPGVRFHVIGEHLPRTAAPKGQNTTRSPPLCWSPVETVERFGSAPEMKDVFGYYVVGFVFRDEPLTPLTDDIPYMSNISTK